MGERACIIAADLASHPSSKPWREGSMRGNERLVCMKDDGRLWLFEGFSISGN